MNTETDWDKLRIKYNEIMKIQKIKIGNSYLFVSKHNQEKLWARVVFIYKSSDRIEIQQNAYFKVISTNDYIL